MSVLPDFTRLLAIGLLNYADDHGFFWANPLMIRGSLFPFDEDSSKIRRSLAQLDAEGFIRLGKTSDGREVGEVVNFKKHQRVDRPYDSEIQSLAIFDERSTNVPRTLDDDSSLDRNSKGIGKGTVNGSENPPPLAARAEEIYSFYPRKEAKQDALKAISKAMKSVSAEKLLAATKAYAAAVAGWIPDDRKYVPHPATWFNRGSYEDDPLTWARSAPQPGGLAVPWQRDSHNVDHSKGF